MINSCMQDIWQTVHAVGSLNVKICTPIHPVSADHNHGPSEVYFQRDIKVLASMHMQDQCH